MRHPALVGRVLMMGYMMRHPALVGRVLMMGDMMRHPALVGRVLMMRHPALVHSRANSRLTLTLVKNY